MTSSNSERPSNRAPRAEWAGWAREASDTGDWQAALERWDACIVKFGPQKAWEARRAKALLELGWLDTSEQIFRRMERDEPGDPVAFSGLVRVAMRKQDWERALAVLTSYRQRHPGAGSGMLANVLTRLGRADEAQELWSELAANEPDNQMFRLMHLRTKIDIARRTGLSASTRAQFLEQIENVARGADDPLSIVQTIGLFEMVGNRRRAREQLYRAVEIIHALDHVDNCFKAIPRLLEPGVQDQLLNRLLERVRSEWIDGKPISPRPVNLELCLLLALSRFGEFQERFRAVAEVRAGASDFAQLNLVAARLRKPRHEVFGEPKVFVIGLSKTGTTSVCDALPILGIDAAHWANPLTHKPLSDIDIYLFGAAGDIGISSRFEQLYYLYPNARFIWTQRDAASWQTSFVAHFVRHHGSAGIGELRVLYDDDLSPYGFPSAAIQFGIYLHAQNLGEAFRTHEQRVRQFFSDKPSGKLLEFNVFAGHGWPELCRFLGCPVPDRDFPWSNVDPLSVFSRD